MDTVKVCALGGLDEKGRDCYVVEINNDIFVLDAGTSLPDRTIPGIDYLIPNIDYLIKNKNRLKAYIISHGHDESMSAIKYIYDYAPAPVYCTRSTRILLEGSEKIHNIKPKRPIDFHVINPSDDFIISGHIIHTFQTMHNASESFGVALETDQGNIVYAGDYIIDYSIKEKDFLFDIKAFTRITQKPALLLLLGSKSAGKQGYCSPNHKIYYKVGKLFKESNKRIFISSFWQNLYRIKEICDLTRESKKKIFFYNKYTADVMAEIMSISPDFLSPSDIIENENLLRTRSQDVVVLLLGNGGELYEEFTKLANHTNDDKRIILGEEDIFINAALATPTLEVQETRSVDSLYRTGCEVVWLKRKDVTAMHACKDDIKAFLSLLTPKYFMPVRGTFVQLMDNAKIAVSMGIGLNHMNVFIVDNGMQIVINGITRPQVIPAEVNDIKITPVLIDGKGITTKGAELIEERKNMAVDGIVIIASTVSLKEKKIIAGPDCQMRGFVYVKEAEPLLKSISNIYIDEINIAFSQNDYPNFDQVVKNIQDRAQKFIKRENGRTPLILPIIVPAE